MKRILNSIPMILTASLLLVGCSNEAAKTSSSAGAESKPKLDQLKAGNIRIGDKLPDFELPVYGTEGETLRLHDLIDGESYVAVVWHSPSCPCATNCMEAVRSEMSGDEYSDLKLVGVVSDKDMDQGWFKADLDKQVEDGLVTFPLLIDEDGSVMRLYGAKRTPTVWLADLEGNVQFWGAPENTLYPGSKNHRVLLKDALLALRAGETPDPVTEPPIGCLISVPVEEKEGSALSENESKDV